MSVRSPQAVTQMIRRWQAGDATALNELVRQLDDELRRMASRFMQRENAGHTLQSTALVHEAYLRLAGAELNVADRGHFLALAAQTMRRILVDHARGKARQKRSPGQRPITLDESVMLSEQADPRLIELDEALNNLASFDARMAKAVELVFFGGLTTQQAADALGISRVTLSKDLNLAKAWLHQQMSD